MVYFSDLFDVDPDILDEYGAFNISLINDLPLFIDPFLLYASDKPEYQELHNGIVKYLSFLKDKAAAGEITEAKIKRWFSFPEVKQVWFGFSEKGNGGAGLGSKFGTSMSGAIVNFYKDLGAEKITNSSHLEKLGLFKSGVGKDNISDFTCNLIKEYLLEYTQTFANRYLDNTCAVEVSVEKVYFDYERETWMPRTYRLPYINGDYVILTPKDILTKDDTWINFSDMKWSFLKIVQSVENIELRDKLNDLYQRCLPPNPKEKDFAAAIERVIRDYPEFMDYYIRMKEEDKEGAQSNSDQLVSETTTRFISNVQKIIGALAATKFYELESKGSFTATLERIKYLKDFIENKDGYRLFYVDGKAVGKEKDLQLLFKLLWFASEYDANAEVNNGRGPVDYKVSAGVFDNTLVEFKIAQNKKLKQNLQHQVEVYKAANNTDQALKVILFFTRSEEQRVLNILKELEIDNDPNIILIDATYDKPSASNVKV